MTCPACHCQDGTQLSERPFHFRGVDWRILKVRCRHCRRVYTKQLRERSEDPEPKGREDEPERNRDNPFL